MTDYSVQNWVNGSAGKTPITADRLNHMELGIYRSHVELDHLDQQFRASLDDILFQVGQYAKLINGGGLQAYWDSIAKIQSQRTDIVVIGDSISEGVGTNQWSQRFPVALQTLLRTQHSLPAEQAAGDLPVHDYSGLTQPGLSITGYPASPSDQYGLGSKALGIFQDTTVTYTFTGTNFHMFYGWYPDYTNSTECVVTIDGGAPTVVVAQPEPVGSGQFWASPFLTYGTHTVTVKGRSAMFPFMLERFVSYGSLHDNGAGIHVFDGAHGGWATNNFIASAGEYAKRQWQVIKTINPVLTIINLGTNDIAFGTSAAQLKSNLERMIEELLYATNKPHSVLLVIPFRHVRPSDAFPNFQEDWDAYRAAIKSLAGENVAVMDLDNVWPKLGPNDPKGVMYETGTTIVHPNQAGHALLVSSIAGALSKPSTAIVAAASDEAVSEALTAPMSSAVLATSIEEGIEESAHLPATYFKVTEAPINPERYGAVFNGTTNDRPALQAMFDSIRNAGTVRPVIRFPARPVLLEKELQVNVPGATIFAHGTRFLGPSAFGTPEGGLVTIVDRSQPTKQIDYVTWLGGYFEPRHNLDNGLNLVTGAHIQIHDVQVNCVAGQRGLAIQANATYPQGMQDVLISNFQCVGGVNGFNIDMQAGAVGKDIKLIGAQITGADLGVRVSAGSDEFFVDGIHISNVDLLNCDAGIFWYRTRNSTISRTSMRGITTGRAIDARNATGRWSEIYVNAPGATNQGIVLQESAEAPKGLRISGVDLTGPFTQAFYNGATDVSARHFDIRGAAVGIHTIGVTQRALYEDFTFEDVATRVNSVRAGDIYRNFTQRSGSTLTAFTPT